MKKNEKSSFIPQKRGWYPATQTINSIFIPPKEEPPAIFYKHLSTVIESQYNVKHGYSPPQENP